ncbi:hypothetical protein EJB05_46819 [Eragrostis curvula]|uniref:Uncharacterized protein n=1 Tax=Eragrostis curvula TaxID=38414 RepID=A0A5J9T5X6_9POAL|nr:hypothetical protein EJB05_46819 [Eragrostis curvula]
MAAASARQADPASSCGKRADIVTVSGTLTSIGKICSKERGRGETEEQWRCVEIAGTTVLRFAVERPRLEIAGTTIFCC